MLDTDRELRQTLQRFGRRLKRAVVTAGKLDLLQQSGAVSLARQFQTLIE
jgi:uncharacterized lipoprotein YmbA